jgi:tetratricopeptide (TPR) repeat protein
MWITGGALAAMLIMGIMTAFAIQSRNEAARHRAEAEGLVEYMLTDLRDTLKGVNRLDAMQGVNRRAMEHYTRQGDLASLPADSLERRARILHAMGEDDDRDGKLDSAQTKFKEAHRTTAALLAQQPTNADRIFAHAQSEYWVGYAAWRKADLPTVARYWRSYLRQAEALQGSEPGTTRSLMELGYANGNLCDLIMRAKQGVERAIEYCGKAVDYERKALAQKPDDAKIGKDLANRIGWLSETLVSRNEFDRAIALRREEQDIIDRLLKSDPRNFELQWRSIAPIIGIGWAEYSRKQFGPAASHFKAALADLDALAKTFPNDQSVIVTQVRAAIMLAMTQRSSGNPEWPVSRAKAGEYAAKANGMAQPEALTRVTEILAKFDREVGK